MKIVSCGDNKERIIEAFLAGFFMNTAKLDNEGKKYISLVDKQVSSIHPSSVLFMANKKPKFVFFNEIILTNKYYMREISTIEESWLLKLAPKYFKEKTDLN